MRLKKIDIKDWRILHHPQWLLTSTCCVVIGENGSGKSSLIELVVRIFNEVFLRLEKPTYKGELDGYYLNYERELTDGTTCDVVIESGYLEGSHARDLHVTINGSPCPMDMEEDIRRIMPTNIITYYAGDTNRLEKICNHYLDTTIKAIIRNGNNYSLQPLKMPPICPFIYSDLIHLPTSLFSLIVGCDRSETLAKLGIDRASVTLQLWLKRPQWANKEGGGILGNRSPLLEGFLKGLMEYAMMMELHDKKTIELEIDANSISDFLNEIKIEKKGVFLFEMFNLLQYNGFIDDIELFWNKIGDERLENPIKADYFSEGEKQMVLTSAMIEFWDMEHCLFLFDEPDTFLHPKWQTCFLPEVQKNLRNSQAIITTHSVLMVSSVLPENELFVMEKGRIIPYGRNTFGMDTNDINSLVMNTPPRNQEAETLIQSIRQDITLRHLEDAKRKLDELRYYNVSSLEINRLTSTINRIESIGR